MGWEEESEGKEKKRKVQKVEVIDVMQNEKVINFDCSENPQHALKIIDVI